MRSLRNIAVLALALPLALAVGAQGQAWRGEGRIQGTVKDIDGQPIAGARVTLAQNDARGGGPPPVTTGKKGRWALLGLAGGRWSITVTAEGHLPSSGWVTVAGEGPSPNLDVMLRSAKMVPPNEYEGKPSVVFTWLDDGNLLLDQGRFAEARAQYEKALAILPDAEKPQVLRSIARTYYMQGKTDEAVTALKRALLAAPSDRSSRELFTTLMNQLGRGREARQWLESLASKGAEKVGSELEVGPGTGKPAAGGHESPQEIHPEPPRANRTGHYATFFTERSPLSSLTVLARRYDRKVSELKGTGTDGPGYNLAKETFDVVVPKSYRPGKPAALLVWVSPSRRGGISSSDLVEVLDKKDIVWVGANQSSNARSTWVRLGLALDAAYNMQRLYDIDPNRVYVAGYSGGGRVASALGMLFTDVFHGALCFMGVDYYRQVPVPYKPGAHWAAGYPQPSGAALELAEKRDRYVLVTGTLDFNRVQTQVYAERLRRDGFQHVTFLVRPGASHYTRLRPEMFARALDALEGRGNHD